MAKFNKEFKINAVKYYHKHRELGLVGCATNLVVSRFFRKFISSASKYQHQMYGFSSSAGCSISILNRCSMSI